MPLTYFTLLIKERRGGGFGHSLAKFQGEKVFFLQMYSVMSPPPCLLNVVIRLRAHPDKDLNLCRHVALTEDLSLELLILN
jgi:hypothetical protein